MSEEMVKVEDPETGNIITIPARELAPDMVMIRVPGDGHLYVHRERIQKPGQLRHPPFPPDVVEQLRQLQELFADVMPSSLEEWLHNFRRDVNPEKEIVLWQHAAEVFRHFTQHLGAGETEKRRDIFEVIMMCMNVRAQDIRFMSVPNTLTRKRVDGIAGHFFAEWEKRKEDPALQAILARAEQRLRQLKGWVQLGEDSLSQN